MKILVCGGRSYSNRNVVTYWLEVLHPTVIVNGGANGADALARQWADQNDVTCLTYPAEWDVYGRKAGPIRNLEMLIEENPDLVLAFPGSDGTANMIHLARTAGHSLLEISDRHDRGATPAIIG